MAARPLPPQFSRRENRRLCNVVSSLVDWNAPEIGDMPPLPFQKLRLNRALKKGTAEGNNEWNYNLSVFITYLR